MYTYLLPEDDGLPMRSSGQWALEKLDYLKRLIDVFETSMRNKWPVRNYVDLLAGPGKNRIRGAGTISLGSPLLALTTRHPFTKYYFVDFEARNADALSERCRASPHGNRVDIRVGDCNLLVDQIVTEIANDSRNSLNLAFLDPEGLELRWTTVARLASLRRIDLIINYPEGGLNRLMSREFESATETRVDRFFGTPDWRGVYGEWRRTRHVGLHRRLIDLYRSRLDTLGYVEVRRGDQSADEPLMRNSQRRAPLYRLLYASKHPLGAKFWHDVTRRDVYGQARLFER